MSSLFDHDSFSAPLLCGGPQSFALGLVLHSLHLLPLESTLKKHGVAFQSHPDDTQIYMTLKKNDFHQAAAGMPGGHEGLDVLQPPLD